MRAINLLPPEEHRRAQARRRRLTLVGVGVLYLLLLVMIGFYWRSKVTGLERELEAQEARNAQLQAQIDELGGSRDLKDQYDQSVAMLQHILASDVAWGRLLNDLGRVIPDRLWLSSFSGEASASPEADGETTTIGQVTVSGTAFEYPDVASWLRTVDSDRFPAVGAAWVGSATVGSIGEADVVRFSSVALLTPEAISDRAETRIPRVPG